MTDRCRQARLPGTTNVWVQVCNSCGAIVLDESQHDEWHLEMEEDDRAPAETVHSVPLTQEARDRRAERLRDAR